METEDATGNVSIPTRCDQNPAVDATCFYPTQVSIPTRCDQNRNKFPSMMAYWGVSIPTRCDQNHCYLRTSLPANRVSIPTRCDQNSIVYVRIYIVQQFQFRHGAIKTGWGYATRWRNSTVSIPTRCDQNLAHFVSYKLPRSVSIPTRCDQNVLFTIAVRELYRFQFRHGAIKTKEGYLATITFIEFQFRHGAIKTPFSGIGSPTSYAVSIPTRCDQNFSRFGTS